MRKYHLSYDVIDCDKHFKGDYTFAKTTLLTHLKNNGVVNVECPCESTIIFTHPDIINISTLAKVLKDYFYFSLCRVAKSENRIIEKTHQNNELNSEVQRIWESI